jgi:uncharacterized membrane protein (DUF4010 family)
LVTFALAGLSVSQPGLASGLGVLVAGLLYAKASLRRFGRELIHEDELKELLLLCAAALLSILSSLVLFVMVLAASSPALMSSVLLALVSGAVGMLLPVRA